MLLVNYLFFHSKSFIYTKHYNKRVHGVSSRVTCLTFVNRFRSVTRILHASQTRLLEYIVKYILLVVVASRKARESERIPKLLIRISDVVLRRRR